MEVLHPDCAGLDVHKNVVVACVRHMVKGRAATIVKTFKTTTQELIALSDWLSVEGVTHLAMEATGVYWKPVWHILSDGGFELVLANAAHVKNVPGRKTDVNDATWLADLMAHGLIRASFVPDDLRAADAAERAGKLSCLCGVPAVQQKPKYIRCVPNTRQNDLRLDGVAGEEGLRYFYQRGRRRKQPQASFDRYIRSGRHVRLSEVIE
jgi:hypothetical protein